MASLNPQLLSAIVSRLRSSKIKPNDDGTFSNPKNNYDAGVEEAFPSDEVIDGLYSKDGNLLVEGVESRVLSEPTIPETEHIKAFELDRSELFPPDITRISNSKTRPATIQKKKGREFYKKKAIVEGDLSQSKGNYSSSPEFDTPIARTEDTAGFNPLDAANVPIRADEIVNPNRQKAAGLDLEGEKIGMQMDKIQEIIDKDGFLRALGEDDLRDLMPDIISNNKSALNIKPDVQKLSTNVFDKLNELKESAKNDKTLLQKVEVLRAQAAQANERKDEKTLQLMLEQLTGTDAGLEGLARFGKSRPGSNNPTLEESFMQMLNGLTDNSGISTAPVKDSTLLNMQQILTPQSDGRVITRTPDIGNN